MANKKEDTTKIKDDSKSLSPLRLGIICNETNIDDLMEYKDDLISINLKLAGMVELVIFGYDGIDEDNNWLDGVNFEYVKPTTIFHYFKQLKALNIDVLFIPLINNIFNATSENYNKYLEAALFNIPILTTRIYPYNTLIVDKRNGFLYKDKHELITYIEHLYTQRELVKSIGRNAHSDVVDNFNYSTDKIKVISDLFV